jgi:hypothetical protein
MDFYNVLYWSGQDGIYTIWKSVYPPINFLLLRVYQSLFISELFFFEDGFDLRNIVGDRVLTLLFFYVLCLGISLIIILKKIKKIFIKILLGFVIIFSSLFLFSIERANIIIICLPFLAADVVTENKIYKSLIFSVIVNLKPYLLMLYIVEFLNTKSHAQNKDFLILAPIASLILFIVSGLVLNQEFYLMPLNLIGFGATTGIVNPQEVLAFPSSIASFSAFKYLMPDVQIANIFYKLPTIFCLIFLGKTTYLIIKNYISQDYLIMLAIIMLLNLPIHIGGYAALFYVPIISLLYRNKEYFLLGLILSTTFCSFWDLIDIIKLDSVSTAVYLSGQQVIFDFQLAIGSIIRPASNFFALVYIFRKIKKNAS